MKPAGDAPSEQGDPAFHQRYARQLVLPDLGPAGQQALVRARVLVVGAGGLGSAALTNLAGVGVGTLGVADPDLVELSNLHRQVIHAEHNLGRAKVDSAADRIAELNSTVRVRRHKFRVDDAVAPDLVRDYDVVIDACDNQATRQALSRSCGALARPHVWGAVAATSGQLSVWWAPRGPCFRCVFPHTEPATLDANSVGVLGPVPAVIGTLQAIEAVKILTGAGDPMVGRLLLYEAMASTFSSIRVRPSPLCPCRTAGSSRMSTPGR
ncbi:MAG TPA: HesA/MoeB/ThiF family protein [Dermatophilaceae bacterium]|nr:HesA/MoeB/ThiF family protein [Dermatophilaceae bacterium]